MRLFVILFILQLFYLSEQLEQSMCECRRQSSSRIVGGRQLENEKIPWLVSIRNAPSIPSKYLSFQINRPIYENIPDVMKLGAHQCAGLIVNEHWILTAATCVVKHPSKLKIAAGNNQDLIHMYENPLDIEEIHLHNEFLNANNGSIFNNIALVKVAKPFILEKDNISPACLSFNETNHKLLTIFGWGAYESSKAFHQIVWDHSKNSRYLKELQLLDISESEGLCQNQTDILCTISTQLPDSACQGDQGSALHSMINGKMGVIGLLSYLNDFKKFSSDGLCTGKSVITRLSPFLTWFENLVGKNYCSC